MPTNPYWLRDTATKVTRRVKKLIGRPDPTPWVVRPAEALGGELMVTGVGANSPLVAVLREACGPRGVTIRLAPRDAKPVTVAVGGVTIGAYDRDAVLAAVREAGVEVVPDAPGPRDGDHALVRAYSLFGDQTFVWRSGVTLAGGRADEVTRYDMVTWQDVRAHALMPAFEIVGQVARASGSVFVGVDLGAAAGRLVVTAIAEPTPLASAWFAERVAERARQGHRGVERTDGHSAWLPADLAAVQAVAAAVPPTVLEAMVSAA